MYDITIIGSGICGAALARELSKYKLTIAVLEKNSDVAAGATKTNTATIHSGHDARYGSKKAYYNVLGNSMYDKLCAELNIPFKRNGTIVFASSEEEMYEVFRLKQNADLNGVPDVSILTRQKLIGLEGVFGSKVIGGLYAPSGGVVCPYSLAIALCENASKNGVEFFLNREVSDIKKDLGIFRVTTNDDVFESKYVFNCAGVHADTINNMVSSDKLNIIPRKGAHLILDKKLAGLVKATISQTPMKLPGGGHTKGQGIVPTIDGTILLGCDAYNVTDKDDTSTDASSIQTIIDYFEKNWENFPISQTYPSFPHHMIIGAFAGIRPHLDTNDYVVGETSDVNGFFNLAGIESPGLTAAPALAKEVALQASIKYGFERDRNFDPTREQMKPFRDMNTQEQCKAVSANNNYGNIICRCEQITLAEILAAIRGPIGATTVDAVKMRTRAGMGRCQGGFCGPKIVEIISKELGIPFTEVTQCGPNSNVVPYQIGIQKTDK